jgi:hypothetical protein
VFLGGCIPPYRQVVHSAAAGCLSICVTASALARSANWLSFAGRPGQPGLARHETRHGRRVAVRKARSCVVVGLFCVTTVSIVCTFKAPVPDPAGEGLDPSISMVAGPAGGADGVVGSVLVHGRHPDGPRSRPPLATEHNLNPARAKRGLCPTQRASECAGTARPGPSSHSIAANIYADLQKVGCASRRVRSVCHELAHMGRYRVGVDDVLDRVAPRNSLFDQFNFQLFRHPKPDI